MLCKGVHGKMLAAIQTIHAGEFMSMKLSEALKPVAQPRLRFGRPSRRLPAAAP